MILLDGGKVDGLPEFMRELNEERPRDGDEIGARRSSKPQDGRSKSHTTIRRGRNQKLLGFERGNNALYGRTRQSDPLRDLAKAQACRLLFQRAQDRCRPGNDLHLALALALAV